MNSLCISGNRFCYRLWFSRRRRSKSLLTSIEFKFWHWSERHKLEHSINEPEVYGIFTNANLLGTLASVIKKTPSLQVVVYDGEAKDIKAGALKAIKAASPNIKIYTFAEFISLGERKPVAANPPQPDDLACIMYTSGSTGAPKGVLITNKNIVSASAFN